jgi:hypothetical protein
MKRCNRERAWQGKSWRYMVGRHKVFGVPLLIQNRGTLARVYCNPIQSGSIPLICPCSLLASAPTSSRRDSNSFLWEGACFPVNYHVAEDGHC